MGLQLYYRWSQLSIGTRRETLGYVGSAMSHRPLNWTRASGTVLVAALVFGALHVVPAVGSGLARVEFASAWATAESEDDQLRRAQDISRTTMSPFCPGRTLDACPSEFATQWREDVRTWIAEGVSTDEIRKRLEERTDRDLSGAPSTALDGVMPILVVVLSGLLLVLLLRALLKRGKGTPEPKPKVANADPRALDRRLDDELNSLDD
jgi:cytochrome c-type biogenesis protein CcmH/NrfF